MPEPTTSTGMMLATDELALSPSAPRHELAWAELGSVELAGAVYAVAVPADVLVRAAAPSPLGAPAALTQVVATVRSAAPSPLGMPAVLAAGVPQAWAAVPTMLGAPAVYGKYGEANEARVQVPGPLGAPAALAQPVLAGWVALPGPLGAAAVLAQHPVHGRVAVPGVLGAPSLLGGLEQRYIATGWQATNFGAHYGANAYRTTTIGEVVRFGTPTTPTYTEHQAQGFNHTRFGVPYGLQPFEFGPINQSTNARGWVATQFGTPAATTNLSGQAQGWQAAQFGAPHYTAVLSIESLGTLTQFGAPLVGSGHRVHGFRATQFGAPTCAAGYLAQGFGRTRFGTPRASLPGALVARGWCGTRFGTPRGSLPPTGHAAESFSATQFGVPVATIRHRAATLGPLSRFGRPILRRNPTC